MRNRWFWCLGALAVAGLLAVGVSGAQSCNMASAAQSKCSRMNRKCISCSRGECPKMYLSYRDELGLSAEQVKKLKAIVNETSKKKIRNKAAMDILRIEIDEFLDAEDPDMAQVDAKIDEIARLKAENMKACARCAVSGRKVLTPDQREQARMLMKNKACAMQPSGDSKSCNKMKHKM